MPTKWSEPYCLEDFQASGRIEKEKFTQRELNWDEMMKDAIKKSQQKSVWILCQKIACLLFQN